AISSLLVLCWCMWCTGVQAAPASVTTWLTSGLPTQQLDDAEEEGEDDEYYEGEAPAAPAPTPRPPSTEHAAPQPPPTDQPAPLPPNEAPPSAVHVDTGRGNPVLGAAAAGGVGVVVWALGAAVAAVLNVLGGVGLTTLAA